MCCRMSIPRTEVMASLPPSLCVIFKRKEIEKKKEIEKRKEKKKQILSLTELISKKV